MTQTSSRKAGHYPVAYSMRPDLKARVVEYGRAQKGPITTEEIQVLARSMKTAAKTIHSVLTEIGCEIVAGGGDVLEAEHPHTKPIAFTNPRPRPKASPAVRETPPDLDVLLALEADLQRREADFLLTLADVEADLAAMRTAAAADREASQKLADHAHELRRRTKEDREALEALRGDYGVLQRQYGRLEAKTAEHVTRLGALEAENAALRSRVAERDRIARARDNLTEERRDLLTQISGLEWNLRASIAGERAMLKALNKANRILDRLLVAAE